MDLIGKVTQKDTPKMKVPKVTLWLKDESDQELAMHLWGQRFVTNADHVAGGSVVQVDNALLSKLPAGIEASCEHWSDSARNWFSALHVKPTGSRVETLQALSDARGAALSVPWLQTASRWMVSDGLEKFISCCATVSSCSLALMDAMLEANALSSNAFC